jgi:hypothetical protein
MHNDREVVLEAMTRFNGYVAYFRRFGGEGVHREM